MTNHSNNGEDVPDIEVGTDEAAGPTVAQFIDVEINTQAFVDSLTDEQLIFMAHMVYQNQITFDETFQLIADKINVWPTEKRTEVGHAVLQKFFNQKPASDDIDTGPAEEGSPVQ